MDAERLVALEAAIAELGALYTAARSFTALQPKAEADLLPRLTRLSTRLRALHRTARMSQEDIDDASQEIIDLRTGWHAALEELRRSTLFDEARRAFESNDQPALAEIVPRIFAGFDRTAPPPRAHFSVSVAVRRRGPGTSPFLSAEACAEKLQKTIREGVTPRPDAEDWWISDLPCIHFVAAPADLDTPFAVSLPGADIAAAVFVSEVEFGYRIFTPRLLGAFDVEIAASVDDEWWQAFEQPFEEFRAQLQEQLAARGIKHSLVDML